MLSEKPLLLSEECDEEYYRPIEFYSESTDGRPWFVENAGTEKIEIKTSVGKFELEAGERKQII